MSERPRVVIAPDSWGGFLGAPAIADRIADALAGLPVDLVRHPLADGGEGTEQVLRWHGRHTPGLEVATWSAGCVQAPTPGGPRRLEALCLRHRSLEARVFVSALALDDGRGGRPAAREPAVASSLGLGRWLAHGGVPEVPWWVSLGGSATVDGGVGLAIGLGLTVRDADGRRLPPRGDSLLRVARLEGPVPRASGRLTALADVRTPLAEAQVRFGPQKGLATADIPVWTDALHRWADALSDWRRSHGLPPVRLDVQGGGAAGGVGFALHALLDAPLHGGARTVLGWTGGEAVLRGADLVITGEGRLDDASFDGKVVGEVHRGVRDASGPALLALVGQDRRTVATREMPGLDVVACPEVASRERAFEEGLRRLRDRVAQR